MKRADRTKGTFLSSWIPTRLLSPASIFAAKSACVILAVLVLSFLGLCIQYENELEGAHRTARNFSSVLAEHTARTFEAVSRSLQEADVIRRDFERGRYRTAQEAGQALRVLQRSSPLIVAFGWTDEAGNVKASSYENDAPRPNIADLAHFQVHARGEASGLFISPAFKSRATGRWISAISIAIRKDDGSFGGVVTAPLDLAYFSRIYSSLFLGDNGTVGLLHRASGSVLVREPFEERAVGVTFPKSSPVLLQLEKSDSGSYEAVSVVDGRSRIAGFQAVQDQPLVVIVTMARVDILTAIYRQALFGLPLVLFIVAVVIGGTLFQLRQFRALDEKSKSLTATLENIDQGLAMIAPDGSVKVYNKRALDLLDIPPSLVAEGLTAARVSEFQSRRGEGTPAGSPTILQVLESPRSDVPAVYRRQRPNGTHLEVRTTKLPDGGVVRTYTDITSRLEARQALEREKDRAEAAARAKSDFLATMSHELRTPLTAIIGYTEAILGGTLSEVQRQQYLEIQCEAGRGLLDVINDVLDFSRLESGHVEIATRAFSPAKLVRSCAAMISGQASKKGLEVSVDIADEVPDLVLGDAAHLRQVLLNLLSNAVKFTRQGRISLSLSRVTEKPDTLRFSVADSGIGIEQSQFERLFERFTQVDSSATRSVGGTGLGLAISKNLVELMGGSLAVESAPGKGSIFAFSLEMQPAKAEPSIPSTPRDATLSQGCRILLAEDNGMNRELISAMLTRQGHAVTAVANGHHAIETLKSGTFDIVLLDVQMPVMGGYQAARLIRGGSQACRSLPIVALTANASPEEAERSREAGMNAHIAKPLDWDHLLATIQQLIADPSRMLYADESAQPQHFDQSAFDELGERIGSANVVKLLLLLRAEARGRFLNEPVDDSTRAAAAAEAHSFAGSAGLMGFAEVGEACRLFLEAIRNGADPGPAFAHCRRVRDDALGRIEELIAANERQQASAGRS